MPSESTRVALLITNLLERLSIAYAVEGSLADSDYGVARSTLDAHIIADMRPEHVEPFVAALSGDFYADHRSIENAIEHRGTFTVVHYASKFNVDVILPKLRPFDQMQLARRRALVVSTDPPQQVSVTSPEDAVLSRLERHQGPDSGAEQAPLLAPRLITEVGRMLKAQGDKLDLEYLHHWAKELNVEDLLERALQQV
jgi:hypothetical protein